MFQFFGNAANVDKADCPANSDLNEQETLKVVERLTET